MNALIVLIENPENAEDFLSVLVELDVAGLQMIDSSSVMGILARQAPIFAGLRQLVTRPKADSKLVFGLSEDPNILSRLRKMLKKIDLDLDAPGIGYAVVMPIADKAGTLEF